MFNAGQLADACLIPPDRVLWIGVVERDEEALAALESVWYEVLDAVMSGRTSQLACPECHAEGMQVEERGDRVMVSCPSCKRSVEVVTSGA